MKKYPLATFLIIVAIISAAFIIGIKLSGEKGTYLAGPYMLGPAIAALITRWFFYDKKFKDAHLRLGRWRDYLKYWGIVIILVILSYLIYTVLGSITWDWSGDTFLTQMEEQMVVTGQSINDLPAGMTPKIMLIVFFIGGLTLFNIPLTLVAFGEEFGWRGLMFPLLCKKRLVSGLIIGGLIWFAWHIPLMFIIPNTNDFTIVEQILNIIILAIGSICTFIFFAYVYVKSESIWVASFVHAVFNNASRSFSQYAVIEDQLLANIGLTITMIIVVGIMYLRKDFKVFRVFFLEVSEQNN